MREIAVLCVFPLLCSRYQSTGLGDDDVRDVVADVVQDESSHPESLPDAPPSVDVLPEPETEPDLPPCPAGTMHCSGECVDAQTDPENCGTCGNVCDPVKSDGCVAGNCSCLDALECRGEQKCCPVYGCKNILTDPSNCGDCAYACAIGESCVAGTCWCGTGPPCESTESCCGGPGGVCIDTQSNPNNCGVCGLVCDDTGPECMEGKCTCGDQPACSWTDDARSCRSEDHSMYQLCCDGECTVMDEDNCGRCGIDCDEDETCQGQHFFECVFSCGAP